MPAPHRTSSTAEHLAAAVRDARRTARRLRPRRSRIAIVERHHSSETRTGA